jgi:hypothetical protein
MDDDDLHPIQPADPDQGWSHVEAQRMLGGLTLRQYVRWHPEAVPDASLGLTLAGWEALVRLYAQQYPARFEHAGACGFSAPLAPGPRRVTPCDLSELLVVVVLVLGGGVVLLRMLGKEARQSRCALGGAHPPDELERFGLVLARSLVVQRPEKHSHNTRTLYHGSQCHINRHEIPPLPFDPAW